MQSRRTRGWRARLILFASAVVVVGMLQGASVSGDPVASSPPGATSATDVVAAATANAGPKVGSLARVRSAVQPGIDGRAVAAGGPSVASSPTSAAPVMLLPVQDAPVPVAVANGPSGFTEITGVSYTRPVNCGSFAASCQIELDIYAPTGHGPFPTVVMARGGPGGLGSRGYVGTLARALASLGVLVFNADYRDSTDQGGGYPNAFQDVECAVRYARSEAGRYGGDGSTVTLVGHSLGGWVGSIAALNSSEFDGSSCLAGGSGRPDAFVGLAGCYQIDAGDVATDMDEFFGAAAAQTTAARNLSNPFNYANGTAIPVRLVAGSADNSVNPSASMALYSFLLAKDWNVTMTFVPGANHMSILRTDESGVASLHAVFSAIAAARSVAEAIDPLKARWGN